MGLRGLLGDGDWWNYGWGVDRARCEELGV